MKPTNELPKSFVFLCQHNASDEIDWKLNNFIQLGFLWLKFNLISDLKVYQTNIRRDKYEF